MGFDEFIWTLLIIQGIIVGSFSGFVAREKGRDPLAWFFNGFLFSIVGLIAICGVPSVNRSSERSKINRNSEKSEINRNSEKSEVERRIRFEKHRNPS